MATDNLILPLAFLLLGALLAATAASFPSLGRRRLPPLALSWLLALAPLASAAWLISRLPALLDGATLGWSLAWLPAAGLNVSLFLDNLAALFALLVTGIGTLVVFYTGYYFGDDPSAPRFLANILLFMASMLGLVMAGDVITLFIFWEGTSITSFLLVAHKSGYPEARRGAFKALFITGGGGIALLAGLLLAAQVAGDAGFAGILAGGDALRASPLYPVMLGLIAFGALTKSAQVPAHIWLPDAMSAPTPASAFLHSATMVKAGIYLLARLNPALGGTELWFWLFSFFGAMTMVTGAYLGFKQHDLKALLAYATISQLGVLVLLIGQDTEIAFKALIIGVLAHALYKSALFLVVGIVDHEAGTRDLRRLGGLGRGMPASFAIAAVAALSMAGLPPLFGFLAKETLLATAVHPSLPAALGWVLPALTVFAGAFLLAQSGLLLQATFLGQPGEAAARAHEAPRLMLAAPLLPAALSLAVSILPEPEPLARFLAGAAKAAYGAEVKVSLALWTGLNIPLALSAVAITLGSAIFWRREPVRAWMAGQRGGFSFDSAHEAALGLIDRLAARAVALQRGQLRFYLVVILAATLALVVGFGGLPTTGSIGRLAPPSGLVAAELAFLRVVALLMVAGAALATVFLRRDLFAIIALGVSGLSMALLFVLEPAPDVALVQVVVDILSVVILVLALTRLPRRQRRQAQELTFRQSRVGLLRDAALSGAAGLVVTLMTLVALTTRPRGSLITPFYEANAKPLAGARDIVGAIVVDFRALDTLVEIAVFSLAGLGIAMLLRQAARHFGDSGRAIDELPDPAPRLVASLGIGGGQPSPFLRAMAHVLLPLSLVLAAIHLMYGHDQPGDGFTAGVIVSLAIGFWYVVFGYDVVRARLRWLRPSVLLATGLLLAVGVGLASGIAQGDFLAHIDYGKLLGLPLPQGFSLSSAFLFEVAICLAVLGSAATMLNTLGHPGEPPREDDSSLARPG